jgi:hypothetical protein
MLSIWDRHGNIVSQSRNLRGIRQAVGKDRVKFVAIERRPHHEGDLYIEFENGNRFRTDFASFEVLKDTLRNWRNLHGARLYVDGREVGHVYYRTPALQPGPLHRTFLF